MKSLLVGFLIALLLVGSLIALARLVPVSDRAVDPDPVKGPPSARAVETMKEARKKAADRRRRLVLDSDGSEATFAKPDQGADQFLTPKFTAAIGSQVDTLVYATNAGFGSCVRPSKVWTPFRLVKPLPKDGPPTAPLVPGLDPLRTVVEFGHKHGLEVFSDVRMNDNHDKEKDGWGPSRIKANAFKAGHPKFLFGSPDHPPKAGAWSMVDYGQSEVRESVFRFVEEACRNYDIDGLSLDFFRHPVFFASTARGEDATDAERGMMTDLMKRIRAMADEVGAARGKPILLFVRVPDSVEYCRAVGLDVEHWLANDLADLLSVTSYFQLNDWESSVKLGHKYGVKVYPSLDDPRLKDAEAKKARATSLAYRGRAANVWHAGADGVYLFNYDDPDGKGEQLLGDPKTLKPLDKDYFASPRGVVSSRAYNLPFAAYQKVETLNPNNPRPVKPGETATARLRVGEAYADDRGVKLTLRLRFQGEANPRAAVTLNGRAAEAGTAAGEWLVFGVEPGPVCAGENTVTVAIPKNAASPAVWTDLVLEVRHPAAK